MLDAKLYVDDGLAVRRHAPLGESHPELLEDGWLWRASYEVPASYLTDARTRFALESEPGNLLDLPRPGEPIAGPAVPVTARAAHVARRYAGAIAILLAAAVVPGGLPAMAGDAKLRSVLGQRSWRVASRRVEAFVTRTGGHLAPVVFDRRGRKIAKVAMARKLAVHLY